MKEKLHNLTVTVKVKVNADASPNGRQLAIDHLEQVIAELGIGGIEAGSIEVADLTVK